MDFSTTFPQTQTVDEAVLAAVAYADLFNNCLSDEEVCRLAVGRLVEQKELDSVQDDRLVHRGGYWCLSGRDSLLESIETNRQVQQQKLVMVRRWLWLFKIVPGVLMVGVTGSVAGGSPKAEDDIDVLVICRSDRLWLSRLLLTSWLSWAGKRRKPTHQADQVKDLLCLNMWLSTRSLAEQANIYVANELARIQPLLNRQQTYQRYMAANAWLNNYLPAMRQEAMTEPWRPGRWNMLVLLGDIGELLSKMLLKKIMRRPSVEYITDDRLQFHPGNHRQHILEDYQNKLNKIGLHL